jgi:hypothetical protein
MYRNRMTTGDCTENRSECTTVPSSATISALSNSTKQMARRADTTLSGSYVALSTSALLMVILSATVENKETVDYFS